jgi:hypothetical protein
MVEVIHLRTSSIAIALAVAMVLLLAGPVSGTHVDGADNNGDEGLYPGWGAVSLFGLAMFVYWAFAFPIALLVYTDAKERKLDGARWARILLIPFVGLFALPFYERAQRGYPRTDVYDPWADGDLIERSRRSLNGGP